MDHRRQRLEITDIFSFTKDECKEAKSKINVLISEFIDEDQMNNLRIELGRRKRLGSEDDDEPVYSLSIEYAIFDKSL